MFKLDQELIDIMELIELQGYQIYIVGGFVRDLYLKRSTRDLDLATSMPIKQLKNVLDTYEIESYDEHYGTLKFELKTYEVEITQFRKESNYKDLRHPETVEFVDDLAHDVLRRDFTINALYMNHQGEIIDPMNGLKDIKAKTIQTIRDPKLVFKEDALRIVRLYRFHAQLDFEIEEETLKAAQSLLSTIKELKRIQFKDEAIKILSSHGFETLYNSHRDFIESLFPKAHFPNEVFTLQNSWEYKLLYMYNLKDLDQLLKSWEFVRNKRKYLLSFKRILEDYKTSKLKNLFVKHGSFMWFEMMTLLLNLDDNFVYRNKFIQILNQNKVRKISDLKIDGLDLIELEIPDRLRNQLLLKLLFDHIWNDLDNEKHELKKQMVRYKNEIH